MDTLSTLALAAVLFASTNADDLVLLTVFFAQPGCRPRQVVLGQLIGVGLLTGISHLASAAALALPHAWLPWIGLFPVYLGVRWLFRKETNDAPPPTSGWWTVAGVTLANGADNLGVYIPAFALQSSAEKLLTAGAFLVLTLLWCGLAQFAVRHPAVGPPITQLCQRLAPFVLIGVGLWIIAHHPLFRLRWLTST